MNIFHDVGRVVTRTADATTAAAGALGGAVVTGAIGGVKGTAAGVRNGLASGSHSTPAAVLTLAAIGAAGVVDWPVVAIVGGTALLVHQLSQQSNGDEPSRPLAAVPPSGRTSRRGSRTQVKKSSPRKATKAKKS